MIVRKAKLEDIGMNLLDLYIDGFKYYNGRPDVFLDKDERNLKYVAYQIKEKHDKIMWIDELVVDRKKRCKRVEFCCWSFNQNAMDMYKHMGYKEQRVILEMNL